jgi:hypothetical protein
MRKYLLFFFFRSEKMDENPNEVLQNSEPQSLVMPPPAGGLNEDQSSRLFAQKQSEIDIEAAFIDQDGMIISLCDGVVEISHV